MLDELTILLESIADSLTELVVELVDQPSRIDTLIEEVRGLREDVRGVESAIRASAMKNGGETPNE